MPKYIDLLKARIRKLKTEKGLLITDHQYEQVMEIADEVHLIAGGSIQKINNSEELVFYGYIR